MSTALIYIEKVLFPGSTHGQGRRHLRFLLLAILLGIGLAVAFGAVLYILNKQGRI